MEAVKNLRVWIETLRGGHVESISHVTAVLVDAQDDLAVRAGDPEQPVFWRSTSKFIQALSLFSSGAAERFALSDRELAIACGSHSGGDEHTAVVAGMLEKIGATEADLHCGPHVPLGQAEAKELADRGQSPTKLHNNCSGKHAGMLASCRARGWPLKDYNRLHHPLQQEILVNLSRIADVARAQIQTAVDGCGAVVFRTPLSGLARSFRRLAAGALPAPFREAGLRLRGAIVREPEMVAGRERLCTDLMTTTEGRLVAKIGADGVYTLGVQSGVSLGGGQPTGTAGLALKIDDGNGRLIGPALCVLAARLGLLTETEFGQIEKHAVMPIYNHQREHVGDVAVRIESAG